MQIQFAKWLSVLLVLTMLMPSFAHAEDDTSIEYVSGAIEVSAVTEFAAEDIVEHSDEFSDGPAGEVVPVSAEGTAPIEETASAEEAVFAEDDAPAEESTPAEDIEIVAEIEDLDMPEETVVSEAVDEVVAELKDVSLDELDPEAEGPYTLILEGNGQSKTYTSTDYPDLFKISGDRVYCTIPDDFNPLGDAPNGKVMVWRDGESDTPLREKSDAVWVKANNPTILTAEWIDGKPVTIVDSLNGTVTSNKAGVIDYTEVIFTVTPDPGYQVDDLVVVNAETQEQLNWRTWDYNGSSFIISFYVIDAAPISAQATFSSIGDDWVEINETNFPDANFREIVSRADGNAHFMFSDGILSESELAKLTDLSLSGYWDGEDEKWVPFSCDNVRGIGFLTGLTDLSIGTGTIKELDISGLPNLKTLSVYGESDFLTRIDSLKAANCTALNDFNIWNATFGTVDFSGCNELNSISMSGSNIGTLKMVGDNKAYLGSNSTNTTSKIGTLDLSGSVNLNHYSMRPNNITIDTLNLSNCPNMKWVYCSNWGLSALDVSNCPSLVEVDCRANQLVSLDVTNDTALNQLMCDQNSFTKLDISTCTTLLDSIDRCYVANNDGVKVYEEYIVGTGEDSDRTATYLAVDASVELKLSNDVKDEEPIIVTPVETKPTQMPAPAAPAPAAAVPAPASAEPTIAPIPATKASTKSTVLVGTTYQIDTAGAATKGFKSSNKKVATVLSDGTVIPKKAGKAKITFKVGKKKRTVTLTVKDPTIPIAVMLNMVGSVAAKVGETQTLTVTLPEGTASGIKWKSSNKKIATVSNGVVTFKKKGKVTITATATRGKKKAKVKFIVSK